MMCNFHEGMNANEPAQWVYEGGILRARGDLIGTTHHEAGHAVLKFALGCGQGPVSVTVRYHRAANGVYAGYSGHSAERLAPGEIARPRQTPQDIQISLDGEPFMCWRPMLRFAMIHCGGHASERRYLQSQGLPFTARSGSDREACEIEARRTLACAGRNGEAMLRHAWAQTQRLLEIPQVWRAVQAVEAALFSGLLWREPNDPRPGDEVEFVIEGEQVEALIEGTGLRFGSYWNNHKCGPECVRSRPISKRFRATVEAWASESLKPENTKELCDANET